MKHDRYSTLVGNSRLIVELKEEMDHIAKSEAKVLITGESGVGKELVARRIHQQSFRANGPFVAVNCAGLTDTLLESELFGHVRGSFTGAYRDKPGKLEVADGGTVFLDEMGEMSLRMQGLLLRFLETGELQKVGMERAGRTVNVRVVAATNRQLTEMMDQGLFRRDLFYRLNVIHLEVPPLRQHKEDLPELIDLFLRRFTETGRYAVHAIAPEAIAALTEHTWPGNVRELENTIEQLVVSCRNEIVQVEDLPLTIRRAPTVSLRTKHERRRAVTDDLYRRLVENRESFWTSIYPLFMRREITRSNVRDVVRRGLEDARGNYKIVARLFNVEAHEYKKLLNFLRKHDCQVPFKEYR